MTGIPEVSVVIPARDAAATIPAALDGLARQRSSVAFEVVVVDDGSRDATPALARAAGARVVAGEGRGPAAARNLGAAAAAGALLAFVDADCAPEPGWLDGLLRAAADADLVQGRVLPPDGVEIGPWDRFIAVTSEYGLYETANLAIRREWFERLGGFESVLTPRRGIELGEDTWLGWRARRAGARTAFAADALVRHAVFPRRATGYVAERARLRFFPELARRVPELRDGFLYRRWFLNARSARFDLAAAGALAAAVSRRPAALAAALPYAWTAWEAARGWPQPPKVAVVQVAADVVGAGALAFGSVRARSLLL
jgi:glycosyltransferase involved in cell wall biosynthesis